MFYIVLSTRILANPADDTTHPAPFLQTRGQRYGDTASSTGSGSTLQRNISRSRYGTVDTAYNTSFSYLLRLVFVTFVVFGGLTSNNCNLCHVYILVYKKTKL